MFITIPNIFSSVHITL